LRTRINWDDKDCQYPSGLSCNQREWTHIDLRAERPASEHIDEYIDSQLPAADGGGQ
jgi:hypothetical protein